ncbi:hypothetical protein [uncultured Psychroserpens sp.]|uniref:hypothetical protein n=1 Tax=uncultured Psychroserpens sp. TaxID=255436 RepID=UPI0026344F76|nr:hypothetical protein [uncultured Psychroserpens sp.]
MKNHLTSSVLFVLSILVFNCGSKQPVIEAQPVKETVEPIEKAVTDSELIQQYFNNEFENYRDAHSSTYTVLPPASGINPALFPEDIVFNFKQMSYALYSIELFQDTAIVANYYAKLVFENKQWKVDRIYLYDLQEVMREIYKNTYQGKSKSELLVKFKKERNSYMERKGMRDTLLYNKRLGDFDTYLLKAEKITLLSKTDKDIVDYFKSNISKFEALLLNLKDKTYLDSYDSEQGELLKNLLLESYNYENDTYYFSIIGGFGEGLEGQQIGFLKAKPNAVVRPLDLFSGREPYLLAIPIMDGWYLYKQK